MTTEVPQYALSTHYHKARSHYALASGLLFAYELLGLSFGEQPITFASVRLKDPSSITIILSILVIYFACRANIEWFQCSSAARHKLSARIDLSISHAIGTSSLLIWVAQTVFGVEILNLVTEITIGTIALLIFSLLGAPVAIAFLGEIRRGEWNQGLHNWFTVTLLSLNLVLMLFLVTTGVILSWKVSNKHVDVDTSVVAWTVVLAVTALTSVTYTILRTFYKVRASRIR